MHLRARNASARQSVPRSLPRSPGERCQSTRCCSGSRAARVSATRGAVGQFSRFGVPICTSYTLVDLTPKYLALVSLLTPGRHARVAAHRPPSTLSTVRGTPRPYGFLYASLPGNACHGCRCWRLEVVVFGHEAERHVGSVMRYRVRGGSARRKSAGPASRCASASIRPFAMWPLFWIGRPTVQLGNKTTTRIRLVHWFFSRPDPPKQCWPL